MTGGPSFIGSPFVAASMFWCFACSARLIIPPKRLLGFKLMFDVTHLYIEYIEKSIITIENAVIICIIH